VGSKTTIPAINDHTKKCDYSLKEVASHTDLMNFMAQFFL
jgi:hypothetical protein